jgi:large subunit ribosomal protein L7/L12
MPTLTISEALSQIQVIDQQVAKKQQLIEAYLFRDAAVRDPLARDGGTQPLLAREQQAITALLERKVHIRRGVQAANQQATITHEDETRSIADWLVWKREVVARRSEFLNQMRYRIEQARREMSRHAASQTGEGSSRGRDLVVHVNEKELAGELEALEERQGYLIGQFALKNATVVVDLPSDEACKTGLEGRINELLALAGRPVPATAAPSTAGGGTAIWLMGLADAYKKINVIKVVREITGVGLMEAKNLVEGAPQAIKGNLSFDEAHRLRQQLEAAGARVALR